MTRHDHSGAALCPLCGGTNVREIFPEGSPEHRHVCFDKNCDKITSNRRRRREGLPIMYPEIEQR